jgi:hypothetical protein
MGQILEDKKGHPDTLRKLRSRHDFDELKKDSVATAYLDFNVGSWVIDGGDKLLKTDPEDLRRGGRGQGGERPAWTSPRTSPTGWFDKYGG